MVQALLPQLISTISLQSGAPAEWGSWSAVSEPLSVMAPQQPRMAPPLLLNVDSESVTVQWESVPEVVTYELQWRPEAPGTRCIACVYLCIAC